MEAIRAGFTARLVEIEAYLDLLSQVEVQLRAGPQMPGTLTITVTPQQQKILYSAVFLHLYNLVESTITGCFDSVTLLAMAQDWRAGDLAAPLRREWIKVAMKTHSELHPDKRLDTALAFCDRILAAIPVSPFEFQKGAGAWDDALIREMADRIGLRVRLSPECYSRIRRPYKNGRGPIGFVMDIRNGLAHGSISFEECGAEKDVAQLRILTDTTVIYMREVLEAFAAYLERHEYLVDEKRPARGAA